MQSTDRGRGASSCACWPGSPPRPRRVAGVSTRRLTADDDQELLVRRELRAAPVRVGAPARGGELAIAGSYRVRQRGAIECLVHGLRACRRLVGDQDEDAWFGPEAERTQAAHIPVRFAKRRREVV